MKFRMSDPTDYQRIVRPTFTRSELIGIYNAVLIDFTTNADHILETEELLAKLAGILDSTETEDSGPAPPEA